MIGFPMAVPAVQAGSDRWAWGGVGLGMLRGPNPSRCRAACCMMRDALRRFPSSRPLEQPMTDNGDRRGGLELLSASGFRGPHGLGGPVPADSFGEGVEVGFHCLGPFGAVEPGRERRPSGACLFRIHVLVSAPVRAAAVAAGFPAALRLSGLEGPGFNRAATEGSQTVLAGLRPPELIASRFNPAATTGWRRGSGRSSASQSGWARAQSGSDNEVAVGLRLFSGCPVRLP
jgi:hypothetical protein